MNLGATVGLDLSLRGTGIGVCGSGEAITTRRVITKGEDPIRRMIKIRDEIITEVERLIGDSPAVFIENYSYASHYNGQLLGELGGVVKAGICETFEWAVPIYYVAPGTLKKWATGRGNAKKEQMLLACYKKYGVSYGNSDQADAHFLTDLGRSLLAPERFPPKTVREWECLEAVAKTNGLVLNIPKPRRKKG